MRDFRPDPNRAPLPCGLIEIEAEYDTHGRVIATTTFEGVFDQHGTFIKFPGHPGRREERCPETSLRTVSHGVVTIMEPVIRVHGQNADGHDLVEVVEPGVYEIHERHFSIEHGHLIKEVTPAGDVWEYHGPTGLPKEIVDGHDFATGPYVVRDPLTQRPVTTFFEDGTFSIEHPRCRPALQAQTIPKLVGEVAEMPAVNPACPCCGSGAGVDPVSEGEEGADDGRCIMCVRFYRTIWPPTYKIENGAVVTELRDGKRVKVRDDSFAEPLWTRLRDGLQFCRDRGIVGAPRVIEHVRTRWVEEVYLVATKVR